jgi:hypothetical protein
MQRILNEEAERRLVAAYINGLAGLVGQQVRFRMPSTLEEAVDVAVTVSNAERMRTQDTKRVFSTKRDSSSQGITCLIAGKEVITREIVGHRRRMGPPRGIVAVAIRQEAGGEGHLVKRQGTPPLGGTPAGDKFGAFIKTEKYRDPRHRIQIGESCIYL